MKRQSLKLRSMTWKWSLSVLFGLTILLAVQAFATDYYVDPTNGSDANNGTSSSTAWKTVANVNSSMSIFAPGDRVLFKRGETFTGAGLVIRKGGTPGNPLVFGAYGTGNKPLFSGYSTESAIITQAANISDIVLEDIAVRNVSGTGNMGIGFAANNNKNITIRRCDVEAVGHTGILIMCVDGYLVEDCTVRNCGNSGIAVIGDLIYSAKNGVIRNCIVDGVTDNDGITLHMGDTIDCNLGPNHLIENNVCSNCGEQGIDITAGTDIILRGNETFGNGQSSIVIAWYVKRVWVDKHYSHDDPSRGLYILDSEDVKITRSIVVNGIGWILDVENCRNFEAYDNTFIRTANSTHTGYVAIAGTCQGVKLKNNILASYHDVNPSGFFSYFSGATRQNTGCDFSNNCYWRNNLFLDLSGESGSFVADPKLKNDFSLEPYSPCIDAGVNVGLNEDLFGTPIPQGLAPDIGVAEYKLTSSLSASAGASPTSGTAPLTVYFSASASNGVPPYTYSWNFGDGQSSTQQSPSHTYANASNYTATLTVTDNASATASSTVNINVTANAALSANIVASPTSGQAPLAVNFTGSASGGTAPYTYRWTFGDSGSSTTQNPSHTYTTAGNYTATLTVTDSQSATNSKSLTINVTAAPSPLAANASASPSSGQAPLAVNFTGSASGGTAPYTYSWTFGDSGSSTTQNPGHTYTTASNYTATLTVTDSQSATNTKSLTINVTAAPSPLTATASANPTSGQAPLTVNFTGGASGGTSPYSYSWTFGDTGSSTTQNPGHTYTTAGDYAATLSVTDSQSTTKTKSLTINVTAAPSPLTATASANPTSGQAPLAVNFTGSATGGTSPYSYRWTFGDGSSSTTQNPSHTYSAIGNYSATLTVTDSQSATNSKSLTINVTAAPSFLSASASAAPTSGQSPLAVSFSASASGGAPPYSYRWNFGDGQSSTSQNPSHTYWAAGNYTSILTVTDSQSATATKSISINVTATAAQLLAAASASPTSGLAPLIVNFTGSATGGTAPYSYSWNFGDGSSSSAQNTSHTYSAIGNYTVTLTVTDGSPANANATVNVTVGSISAANLALATETGAPAPGQGGTTDPSPGNHSFSVGSTVQVKSIPNTEYRFSKWTGDITESGTFSSMTTLIMDNNKSLSATFCTKCADVNGDLKITPADAQLAFDIYLGKISNPTWCELENADVKCDGTKLSPKVTPADAQVIFHKYLKKGVASGDCSGNSRAAVLSMQNSGFTNANLTINNISFTPGEDIIIPVIIESPSDIKAFGFDLAFPSNILTFIGLESTELTKDYDQLDANVLSYQTITQGKAKTEPRENLFSGFDSIFASKILSPKAVNSGEPTQDFDQPVANMINYQMLRVGGYKTNSEQNPFSGALVTLIFRLIGELKDSTSISVIATYDDIQNASIGNVMVSPKSREHSTEYEKPARQSERKLASKKYDF